MIKSNSCIFILLFVFWVSYPRNHCQIQHREVLLCVLALTSRSLRASLVSQRVKRLPVVRETWVQSLGRECGRRGFNPWVGKIPCRRKWQPTPVPLPGKFHGWRSLLGSQSQTRRSDFTFTLSSKRLSPGAVCTSAILCHNTYHRAWQDFNMFNLCFP